MQWQDEDYHIVTDVNGTQSVELRGSIGTTALMKSIPEVPRIWDGRADEDFGKHKRENRDQMDGDQKPASSTKPDGYSVLTPNSQIELQDRDFGEHDEDGIEDGEDEEVLNEEEHY